MTTKRKMAKSSAPKTATKRSPDRQWSIEDLPTHLQVELRDRIEQAKQGKGLKDFNEALADADRMTRRNVGYQPRPTPTR